MGDYQAFDTPSDISLYPGNEVRMNIAGLELLIQKLKQRGFQVIGPRLRDGAISYAPIQAVVDLPSGWTSEQKPGYYRVKQRSDNALFGYASAPNSIKNFLHPAQSQVVAAERNDGPFRILQNTD